MKKSPFTYIPGQDLSEYLAPPADAAAVPDVHGNQVGLLQRSLCYRSSPTMTCATCHDIHKPQRDLVAQVQNCLGCHQVESHPDAASIGDRMISRCVDCHMPESRSGALQLNNATSQDAFYFRNHQIGRYPAVAAGVLNLGTGAKRP